MCNACTCIYAFHKLYLNQFLPMELNITFIVNLDQSYFLVCIPSAQTTTNTYNSWIPNSQEWLTEKLMLYFWHQLLIKGCEAYPISKLLMVLTSSNLVKLCIWETLKRNFHIRLEEVGPRPYVISISTISFRCGKSLQLQLLRHFTYKIFALYQLNRTDVDLPMSTTVAVAVLCNRYFVSISYRYHFTIMMHHSHFA